MEYALNNTKVTNKEFTLSDTIHIGCICLYYDKPYIIFYNGAFYYIISLTSGVMLFACSSYERLLNTIKEKKIKVLANGSKIEIEVHNYLYPLKCNWINSSAGIKFKEYITNYTKLKDNTLSFSDGVSYICKYIDINVGVVNKWLNGGNPSMTFLTRVVNAINNRLNNPESTRISHEIIEETRKYKNDQKKRKV